MNLRHSPLQAEHEALRAKLVDFGGWEMPLSYPSGTVAEHLACRNAAAAFDVSHLGTVRVEGPGSLDLLQSALSNDLEKIGPQRAQYTHLLSEAGGVLDDLIVWWVDEERFDVMPNASNTSRVIEAMSGRDVTAERAVVAVQGPAARQVVAAVAPEAAQVGRFRVAAFEYGSSRCLVAGTGYTGEDGVECSVPLEAAASFWRALLEAGATPAGLGARDTLRLEAGLPLHGHELGPEINPLEAGLSWVVGWKKAKFRGKEALEQVRAAGGPARHLVGLVTAQRRPPRQHDQVLSRGEAVGEVTSGNFSPLLQHGIALGFVPSDIGPGDSVEIDLRGRPAAAEVVKPPFHTLDPNRRARP